jgi:dienelactone hydrolase
MLRFASALEVMVNDYTLQEYYPDAVPGKVYSVKIPADGAMLEGDISLPTNARGVVAFAHGSGSSRRSPRNRYVAHVLNQVGLATLLFDLLTREEEFVDIRTAELRFDIKLLARRLAQTTDWVLNQRQLRTLNIGYFGASTGAAAALVAAVEAPHYIGAMVSRGGRPDLAGTALARVQAPTLLIVGGDDTPVIALNEMAMDQLRCEKRLEIVPGATHLFEEPGTLEQVARLAREWFDFHLRQQHDGTQAA